VRIETKFGYCEYEFETDYVHIYNLFVYPKYRRQGRARELLRMAIAEIRNTGYKGSISIVAIPSDNSINLRDLKRFYRKMSLQVYDYYG